MAEEHDSNPEEGAVQNNSGESREDSAKPAGESAKPEEKDGGDETEKPRKSGFQKRINKLTREKYEALKAAEEARRRAEELEARLSSSEPEPKPEDFEEYGDFLKAHAEWVKQDVKREIEKIKQSQSEGVAPEEVILADSINNIMLNAQEKYDDFDQVVASNPDLPISKEMIEAVVDSEYAADVLYFLGKNPQIAESLYNLSGHALAREIGRLEATLSSQPQKQVTKAPDPVKPIDEGSSPNVDEDNLSIEEWIARRNKQVFG